MDRTRIDRSDPGRNVPGNTGPAQVKAPPVRSAPVRPPEPQKQARRPGPFQDAPPVQSGPPYQAQPYRPPRPKRIKKRRFLRFVRAVFILLLLVGAPAVALVLAYGWDNGFSFGDDVQMLIKSIGRHLRGLGV